MGNRSKRRRRSRRNGRVNEPVKGEASERNKNWVRDLSDPRWQGIGAVAGIVSIVVSLVLVWIVRTLDTSAGSKAATANLGVSSTIAREEGGRWTQILHVENVGPAAARIISIRHGATMTMCGTISVTLGGEGRPRSDEAGSADDAKVGAECKDGIELQEVEALDPQDLPGMVVHEGTDVAFEPALGLSSVVARDVLPGEVIWVEYYYELAPVLDERLRKEIPDGSGELDDRSAEEFEELFQTVEVLGDRVEVDLDDEVAVIQRR